MIATNLVGFACFLCIFSSLLYIVYYTFHIAKSMVNGEDANIDNRAFSNPWDRPLVAIWDICTC